jgi:hypothetical protein
MNQSGCNKRKYKLKSRNIEAFQINDELMVACLIDRKPWPPGLSLISASYSSRRRTVDYCKLRLTGTKGTFEVGPDEWIVTEDGIVFPLTDAAFNRIYELDELPPAEKVEHKDAIVSIADGTVTCYCGGCTLIGKHTETAECP